MREKIRRLIEEVEAFKPEAREALEDFRIRFLGRKGVLVDLFSGMKAAAADQKKELGLLLNDLKSKVEGKLDAFRSSFGDDSFRSSVDEVDLSLPPEPILLGARHPLSIVRNRIVEIFSRIGYSISDGPEIEDDLHNFSALNFPEDHPARDMQDTFFIHKNPDIALRTHTSSVQVRVMETTPPPIRTISPGRVYRNEAISARAHCIFHQVEGLYIDEHVSFADLKQTLYYFAREMFGEETRIRLRPSYFPFTEPSAEMDISCNICAGKGCNVCKHSGWVEILGCGMVDPSVLDNCKIDSEKYTGFAFGMGIERITMLKYRINDLRVFLDRKSTRLNSSH